MKIRQMCNTMVLLTVMSAMLFEACTPPAWFDTAEGIAKAAVPIAGAVVSVVDPALSPLVVLVEGGFTATTNTLDTYKAAQTTTNLQSVQAALQALDNNAAQLEAAFQVKNPASDAKIKAVIDLINQSVAEIAALVPPPPPAAGGNLGAKLKVTAQAKQLKGSDITAQYNAIVAGDDRFPQLK